MSVPDSELLVKIAEVLDVSVSELLGERIEKEEDKNDIAEQLMKINEQLIIKNKRSRRIWKTIAILVIVIIAVPIIIVFTAVILFSPNKKKVSYSETVSEELIYAEPIPAISPYNYS